MLPLGEAWPKSNWEGGMGTPGQGAPPSAAWSPEQAEAVPVGRAGPRQLSLPSWAQGPPAGVWVCSTDMQSCLWTQVSLPRLRAAFPRRPRRPLCLSSPNPPLLGLGLLSLWKGTL